MNRWPEWLCVLGIGGALSIILNYHASNGLDIGRDYFPSGSAEPIADSGSEQAVQSVGGQTQFQQEVAQSITRLQQKGFQPIDTSSVLALVNDPQLEAGLVALVDARKEALFQEGHIPFAYLFDHYQMDQYVDEVLPMCQIAEQIIVYCSGGQCEDSEFAAMDLVQLGIPKEKIFIYAAGMRGWSEAGHPLVTGDRFDDLEEWRNLYVPTNQHGESP